MVRDEAEDGLKDFLNHLTVLIYTCFTSEHLLFSHWSLFVLSNPVCAVQLWCVRALLTWQ